MLFLWVLQRLSEQFGMPGTLLCSITFTRDPTTIMYRVANWMAYWSNIWRKQAPGRGIPTRGADWQWWPLMYSTREQDANDKKDRCRLTSFCKKIKLRCVLSGGVRREVMLLLIAVSLGVVFVRWRAVFSSCNGTIICY